MTHYDGDYQPSSAGLILHVPDTAPYPLNFRYVNSVPAARPAIVAIGGDRTDKTQFANYYASVLSSILTDNNVRGVSVYSVVYDFASHVPAFERANMFRRAGRRDIQLSTKERLNQKSERVLQTMISHEPTPRYAIDIYNSILRPRIFDASTRPFDKGTIINNLRGLKFFTHCHGAAAVVQLAAHMRRQMIAAGISSRDVRDIQKNLLVIQHCPNAPMENPAFTTVSFASADDTMMNHHNAFSEYMIANSADAYPMFHDASGGNIFCAGNLTHNCIYEHQIDGLVSGRDILTPSGMIIFGAERNAIIRAGRHCMTGGELPTVSEMVSDKNIDFDELKRVGAKTYSDMLKTSRQRIPTHARQR